MARMEGAVLYRFRRAAERDLPLLKAWRAMPHVAEWWGEPEVEPELEKLSNPNIHMFVVELENRPFAFAQEYNPHAWVNHPFEHLPLGSRGIDQYIGEPDFLCRGHGTGFVRQHVQNLFSRGAPAIGTDPHPANGRARRCYEKAGFVSKSGPIRTIWGTAILMEQWR